MNLAVSQAERASPCRSFNILVTNQAVQACLL